jgi:carbon-monoxide dehydrogenase medium subunit
LTNVSPKPIRAAGAEAVLADQPLTEENIRAAGAAAAQDCDPSSDLRGSAEYKRDLVRVITTRAIRTAIQRAKGGS